MTLRRIETQCALVGHAIDEPAVRSRLDHVARIGLPDALRAALGEAFERLDGVYRVDRIELDLVLTRTQLDGAALPRLWAERIGRALAARVHRRDDPAVAWFASHADLAAAYLEHRFGQARHPVFAFADFGALDLLDRTQAATTLLSARPAYLSAMARRGASCGSPVWLARMLPPADCARLMEAIGGTVPVAPEAAIAVARDMLASAPGEWRGLAPACGALALLLGRAATLQANSALPDGLAPIAKLIVAIAQIAMRRPRFWKNDDALSLADDHAGLAGIDRSTVERLAAMLADRGGRQVVTTIGAALAPERWVGETNGPAAQSSRRSAKAVANPRLDSQFAGIALMLATVRAIGVDARLPIGHAHALIEALIEAPEAEAPAARLLACFLLPPPPPSSDALPPWPRVRPDDSATADAEAWAEAVFAAFAERLPGLAGSSPAYLRRQFLRCDGTLSLTKHRLTVDLARPPLAIVLTMAMMTGEQGSLPWQPDRRLRITLQ